MEQNFCGEAITVHLVKIFSIFYRTQNFIQVFKRHTTGTYPVPLECNSGPHRISLKFILILSYIYTYISHVVSPLGFPTKILYTFPISIMRAT